MEEVKQMLSAAIAKAERMAASLDTQVVEHQRQVAQCRADAMQERAKAAELRRLLSTYGPDIGAEAPNRAATAFSEGGQGVDTTQDAKGVGGREIKHVHVDEEPVGDALPETVWAHGLDVEPHQAAMASDANPGRNEYLLQVSMLTPEQKARYCKPTSNADDFGGMPG